MQKIIDSHVHFWNPETLRYSWLDDVPALNRVFLPSDLPKMGNDWEREKLVFVQADCLPEQGFAEASWVSSLGAEIAGIVAFAPMELGDAVQSYLEQMQDLPLVRGIRRLIQAEARGFSTEAKFVEAVKLLPNYGYSFDICIMAHQFPDILSLVKQCPKVEFILDHCGKPDIKAGEFVFWNEHFRQLANFPNVHCKLSGLVTEANHENWQVSDLKPYIETALDAFGPERILFGSDWPVQRLAADYAQWIELVMASTAGFSADERKQIFYKNAERVYKL